MNRRTIHLYVPRPGTATVIVGLILAGSAVLFPRSTPALSLTRYPWVSLRTTTSMLVAWQTDQVSTGKVLYGPSPSLGSEVAHAGTAVDHAVPLTGLAPGSTYHYRVVSGTDTLTNGSDTFRTAPATVERFRFAAFGDIGRATPEQIEIAARVDSLNADLAILTGDIIYDAGEPQNFTPQYFNIYRPTIARIPFYPSLGNHDEGTSAGQPYLDAFYLPSNNPAATERYYSFDYSSAHFVALEVTVESTAPSAAMLAWLDADLAATAQYWKFVFFHVPMYSNGGGHGGDAVITAALEPILDARGVDLVFQGHNHFYTRTFPISAGSVVDQAQEPSYANPGGPIYIVAGGGGRVLYPLTALSPIEAHSISAFHTTVVDVIDSALLLRAVGRDGTILDEMELVKGNPTAVALAEFRAESDPQGVRLVWRVTSGSDAVAFRVYRGEDASHVETLLDSAGIEYTPGGGRYLDWTAEVGREYYYALGALDARGVETRLGLVIGRGGGPYTFALGRPRPNPFGTYTDVSFTLDRKSRVRVTLVDVAGRVVRTLELGDLEAGPHTVRWDGMDQRGAMSPTGIYFAVARAGDRAASTKILKVR